MFSPNTIRLKPSLLVSAILALIYGSLCGLLTYIDLPVGWLMAAAVLFTLHFIYELGLHGLLLWRHSIHTIDLSLNPQGEIACKLQDRSGQWLNASLEPDCLVLPALTLLVVRTPRLRVVFLTRDNVDPDQFRRLRVLLRMATPAETKPS